jgi:cytochrome d ubiquinol oxidase subunit I
VLGLKGIDREERPPVFIVFWAFRVMVGLGLAMIGLGLWGMFLWWRGKLAETRAFLYAAVAMGPAGFVAVVAGWVTAEVGRQPWLVFGVMRTAQGASPIGAGQVSTSLVMFLAVYAVVFTAGLIYILRLIAEGPVAGAAQPEPGIQRAPGSALAAADEGAP